MLLHSIHCYLLDISQILKGQLGVRNSLRLDGDLSPLSRPIYSYRSRRRTELKCSTLDSILNGFQFRFPLRIIFRRQVNLNTYKNYHWHWNQIQYIYNVIYTYSARYSRNLLYGTARSPVFFATHIFIEIFIK